MDYLILALLFLAMVIVAFLLLREVALWYFKINTAILSLKNIEVFTQKQEQANRTTNLLLSILISQNSDKKIVAISKKSGTTLPVSITNLQDLNLNEYDIEILNK